LIRSVTILSSRETSTHVSGTPFELEFVLDHKAAIQGACLSFQIVNSSQTPVTHCWIYDVDQPICRSDGPTRLRCNIDQLDLNVGSYTLSVYFTEPPGGQVFDVQHGICPFNVVIAKRQTLFGWRPNACCYLVDHSWKTFNGNVTTGNGQHRQDLNPVEVAFE
jgi:hypothetical protein